MAYEELWRNRQSTVSQQSGASRTRQLQDRAKLMARQQEQQLQKLRQDAVNRQEAEQRRRQVELNRQLRKQAQPKARETVRVGPNGVVSWSGGAGTVAPGGTGTAARQNTGSGTPNYAWAKTDYQAILNDPSATGEQKAEARSQRADKIAYMEANDFQQLINDEMARENPNLTTVAFWNQMRNQKLGLQGQTPSKGYNDSDYTQDFQAMYNDAIQRGDSQAAASILADRQAKIDFLSNNDMQALANQAQAEGNPAMAAYYQTLHQQKLANPELYGLPAGGTQPAGDSDLRIEGYNTADYTQDFQALANAETDPERKQQLLYARDNKLRFLAANDLKGLADEARRNGDPVMEDYYNQLHYQKLSLFANTDFESLIAQARESGDANMEQAYTQLRNQKLTELFRNDYNALISEAAARGDMGEVELYQNLRAQKLSLYANSDFTALAREALANGDQELADIYTALHNEKRAFLEGNDLEALAQEAEKLGNSELAAIYRQLREQKIQNGYGTGAGGAGIGTGTGGNTGTTPGGTGLSENPFENFQSFYNSLSGNSNIAGEYDRISEQLRNLSRAYEDQAESQYQYNAYKAQADADENITAMYQKFYQQDLPAFKERIANYGLSAAGGLSRQENLMMQSALMAERNDLEISKNETIMQARMEADKLIAEGRLKEAEQILQIGLARASAIADEQQNNLSLAMQMAQLISDKQEKQADRDFELTMQERKEKQEEFITRLKHLFEGEQSDQDFLEQVNILVKTYDLMGIFDDVQTENDIYARNEESKNIMAEDENQGRITIDVNKKSK